MPFIVVRMSTDGREESVHDERRKAVAQMKRLMRDPSMVWVRIVHRAKGYDDIIESWTLGQARPKLKRGNELARTIIKGKPSIRRGY